MPPVDFVLENPLTTATNFAHSAHKRLLAILACDHPHASQDTQNIMPEIYRSLHDIESAIEFLGYAEQTE